MDTILACFRVKLPRVLYLLPSVDEMFPEEKIGDVAEVN